MRVVNNNVLLNKCASTLGKDSERIQTCLHSRSLSVIIRYTGSYNLVIQTAWAPVPDNLDSNNSYTDG